MAKAQELRQAITYVADRQGPILSAYLSVNADIPENQGRTYLVRLRDAMNDEDVPKDLQQRIRDYLEAEDHPAARTLAIFVDRDDLFAVYRLQVDVPESFRWGDPFVAPLTLVLDEYEPYGAAVLDAERFRYFVVSPLSSADEEEEVKANGFKEIDLHPSEPYPRGGGSTHLDPAGRKHESNIHDLYKELGERTRDITFQEGVKRLILAGPRERTTEFRGALPNELKERIVAEEHVDISESEGELLDDLEAIRERAEHEREKELLGQIRERGVRGPDETIAALQEENRVYHLAALWEMEAETRWCDNDQLAIRDVTAEECPFCGQKTRVRPLTDVLVDLAAARGARIDFMLGENENTDVLRDEFGGIAGPDTVLRRHQATGFSSPVHGPMSTALPRANVETWRKYNLRRVENRKEDREHMLTAYVRAAMRRAHYEIVEDDGSFYGEIPDFDGVWASADTLEGCREELAEVLEGWIVFSLSKNLPLPTVDGISLGISSTA